jgi:hypothetical protein
LACALDEAIGKLQEGRSGEQGELQRLKAPEDRLVLFRFPGQGPDFAT